MLRVDSLRAVLARWACPLRCAAPQVEVSADNGEELRDWDGWVNSRMRKLVKVRAGGRAGRPDIVQS